MVAKLLTGGEVAKRLHVGTLMVQRWVNEKKLVPDAKGKKTLFFTEERVAKFLNSNTYKQYKAPKPKVAKEAKPKDFSNSHYANYVRWARQKGETPLTYEQWKESAKDLPTRQVEPVKVSELAHKTAELVCKEITMNQAKTIAGLLSKSLLLEFEHVVKAVVQTIVHDELVTMFEDEGSPA